MQLSLLLSLFFISLALGSPSDDVYIKKLVADEAQKVDTKESITLLPPFDEQGAAGTATGVVYTTVTSIGQGDLTGQALVFFAKYNDKYVKTGDLPVMAAGRSASGFSFLL